MRRNYHDVVLQWGDNPPIALSDMPFGYMLTCDRVGGWQLWFHANQPDGYEVAGEYHSVRLTITMSDGTLVCGRKPAATTDAKGDEG